MKISLSKPQRGKRNIILDMTREEEYQSWRMVSADILDWNEPPNRTVRRDGMVRYRISSRYLDRLLSTFPFAELSPGLHRRLHRATEHESHQEIPSLTIPGFTGSLYDFQKISVAKMIERLTPEGGFFFNNDDLGLGKTVQAIAAMSSFVPETILVSCPNNAKYVWERMFREFTDWADDIYVLDSTIHNAAERTRLIDSRRNITIVNHEALRTHEALAQWEYDFLVTDEFHRFKNPEAKQTKAWHALKWKRHLAISGTPIMNRPEEAWSAFHMMEPEAYPNHRAFEAWLCIRAKSRRLVTFSTDSNGRRRRRAVTIPGKVVGYKPDHFNTLKEQMQDPDRSCRRRREQVLDDLPEVTTNTLLVELTKEQRTLYNRIKEESKLVLANGQVQDIRGILPYILRAKQACFSPELYGGSPHSTKITELKTVVEELVEAGHKALIGTQWKQAARILARELAEYNPAYVDGTVVGQDRLKEQDRFQEDEDCRLYIGTIMANQEAITLSEAGYVIFTDKLWSPLANQQFIGRSAAGGLRGVGHDHVNIIELFARDTIEERIEEVLERKRAFFNSLVERDGGPIEKSVTVSDIGNLF
jgi:non-specific serine/threonine protein kinase